jgi:hypothetical protein
VTRLLRGATVDIHKAVDDETVDARTRKLLQLLYKKFVESFRSLLIEAEG